MPSTSIELGNWNHYINGVFDDSTGSWESSTDSRYKAFGLQHQIGILELLGQLMYTLIPTKMDSGIVQMRKLERRRLLEWQLCRRYLE